MTCLMKSFFLPEYFTKSDGGFRLRLQILSYTFIILKHIQINSQFRKILILKVGGQSLCDGLRIKNCIASNIMEIHYFTVRYTITLRDCT